MAGGVLIVLEFEPDGLRAVSAEVVTAGRSVADALGKPLIALAIGHDIAAHAGEVGVLGIDRLLVADDVGLAGLTTEPVVAVLSRAIDELDPDVLLIPGTTAGRDYAPRLAARRRVGLAADCVDFSIEGGDLIAVRPVIGGRVQTAVRLPGQRPQIATVRSGSFAKAASTSSAVDAEPFLVELKATDLRVTVTGTRPKEGGAANLDVADRVVSGGRGLKEPDNFRLVEELAEVLDAAVGATRAVVDAGWRPHHEQIGQTGRTISPRLYIAIGVSGAVQHNVGMQGSDYIVAINRDPDAPIFKIASFGIVGDLFEIIPALTSALREATGR